MNDTAQMNLKEPAQVDWDNLGKSGYAPPPDVIGADSKPIVFFGSVTEAKEVDADQDYLNYQLDIKLRDTSTGRPIRTWASTRPFAKKNPETGELEAMKGNPNALAKLLRSAGLQAKPQTNSDYRASVRAIVGKPLAFTGDWEARNKDTGEKVSGYLNFPEDPERPGRRKAILKAGDVVTERDKAGNITGTKTIQSEVLFANLRIKYFQDPAPKTGR